MVLVLLEAWGEVGARARRQHYYTQESVGIASGFLLAALHRAGLATLTHTPSPMGFLARILGRPANEKPYLLIPLGYPAAGCEVPNLARKGLDEIRVRTSNQAESLDERVREAVQRNAPSAGLPICTDPPNCTASFTA